MLITVRQGVWLRCRVNAELTLQASLEAMMNSLSLDIAEIIEDRRLEPDLRLLLKRIRQQHWTLYE